MTGAKQGRRHLWQRVQHFNQIFQHPMKPIASPLRLANSLLIYARLQHVSELSGICLSHTKAPLALRGHVHSTFACIPISGNPFLNNSLLLQALISLPSKQTCFIYMSICSRKTIYFKKKPYIKRDLKCVVSTRIMALLGLQTTRTEMSCYHSKQRRQAKCWQPLSQYMPKSSLVPKYLQK